MRLTGRNSMKDGSDNRVVTLDSYRPRASLSPLRQAEAYWSALAVAGAIPKRSAIDPRGLSNLLQHAFILERVAPGVARFRLAGQHLAQISGMDVSGMPVSALFAQRDRAVLGDALERLFERPEIVEITLAGQSGPRRAQETARMILLPLASECGSVNRALGVIVSDAETPVSFGQFQLIDTRFRSVRKPTNAGVGRGAATGQGRAAILRVVAPDNA